jgi:branched-subunit amino acid ABC-type transport system permease component
VPDNNEGEQWQALQVLAAGIEKAGSTDTAALRSALETVAIDAFVIVIIGGMGSFLGSLIAALLIAFTQVFGEYYLPDLALAFMYLLMLIVLVVRPGGLLGKEA